MAIIIVHCGAGSREAVLDAAEEAVATGLDVLREGGSALEAVTEATVVLEDDDRLNAGMGSRLNLDGIVEMDASLMDSQMNCGAVAAIRDVKNPILVARKVMDTPHVLLCGEGAVGFARRQGFPEFSLVTPGALKALDELKRRITEGDLPSWAQRWRGYWEGDTVGAVARDDQGGMAAANSTGGTLIKLPGRVGDTPLIGCGLYAGAAGAVSATGVGEEIVRRVLCKTVYDRMASGVQPQEACDAGVALLPKDIPVGIIAVDRSAWGVSFSTKMAWRSGHL